MTMIRSQRPHLQPPSCSFNPGARRRRRRLPRLPRPRSARSRRPTWPSRAPKPPFDLTGVWLHAGGPDNGFRFSPPPGFKLTPDAQVHYDAAQKAQKEGKVYRDDIGQCWPAGLPVIMTRVWPIAMMQFPTVIYMVSEFMNSLRVVYMDGRPHSDPDVVVPSFNGESIGRWEGDTLVDRHAIFRRPSSLDRFRHSRQRPRCTSSSGYA